ncbi:MAG: hypothetical protein EBQ96_05490 [Proteobacteria bacterium]|nr:hypothetical protein [Pseudomonadota bacterium]
MPTKPATYTCGDLGIIWPDGRAPRIEDATLRRIYNHVFLPALKADIVRLHTVMVKSLQPIGGPDFNQYLGGLGTFKASIGRTSIPDIDQIEAALRELHKKFLAGKVRDFGWDIMDITQGRKAREVACDNADFLETRYRCIGFDTSDALKEIGALMVSEKGRAALYIATMQGRGPLKDLLTVEWPNDRRSTDIAQLRERMYECTAQLKMAQGIAHAKAHGQAVPGTDDADSGQRTPGIRLVAGTQVHRAA